MGGIRLGPSLGLLEGEKVKVVQAMPDDEPKAAANRTQSLTTDVLSSTRPRTVSPAEVAVHARGYLAS